MLTHNSQIWIQYHITDLQIFTDIIIEDHIKAPGLLNSVDSKYSFGKKTVEDLLF